MKDFLTWLEKIIATIRGDTCSEVVEVDGASAVVEVGSLQRSITISTSMAVPSVAVVCLQLLSRTQGWLNPVLLPLFQLKELS